MMMMKKVKKVKQIECPKSGELNLQSDAEDER